MKFTSGLFLTFIICLLRVDFALAASTTSSTTAAVTISATNSLNDGSTNTGLPTLVLPTLVLPTSSTVAYPTVTIPPTSNNPFLQQSAAVDGTVFIAVGSVIGGIALTVLIWRALVAYSLRRSAAAAIPVYSQLEPKTGLSRPPSTFFGAPGSGTVGGNANSGRKTPSILGFGSSNNGPPAGSGGIYGLSGAGSVLSLDQLTSSGRTVNAARPGGVPGASFHGSAFYSPTADVMSASNAANGLMPMAAVGSRSTTYLPAGFYGIQGSGSGASSSTGNLTARYPSQIGSPQRSASPNTMSSRAANLTVPSQSGQRAPSAYLQDLLDSNNNLLTDYRT